MAYFAGLVLKGTMFCVIMQAGKGEIVSWIMQTRQNF